ncbi:MAG: hypothetical protein LUI13_07300 [Lachnospiraceae bacterium]|nr:hypothetical protein [Lachnospiraceae bacterium]
MVEEDDEMLETSMDDIELRIAKNYLEQNKKYMASENGKTGGMISSGLFQSFHLFPRSNKPYPITAVTS